MTGVLLFDLTDDGVSWGGRGGGGWIIELVIFCRCQKCMTPDASFFAIF